MSDDFTFPRIGVGVLVRQNNKILLGKRRGSHGAGTWAPPGGHLEKWETVAQCAAREVIEETGLIISYAGIGSVTEDRYHAEQKHYVTLITLADYISGVPQVKEPDKCEQWEWFEWGNLPSPLFLSIANLVKSDFSPLAGGLQNSFRVNISDIEDKVGIQRN